MEKPDTDTDTDTHAHTHAHTYLYTHRYIYLFIRAPRPMCLISWQTIYVVRRQPQGPWEGTTVGCTCVLVCVRVSLSLCMYVSVSGTLQEHSHAAEAPLFLQCAPVFLQCAPVFLQCAPVFLQCAPVFLESVAILAQGSRSAVHCLPRLAVLLVACSDGAEAQRPPPQRRQRLYPS
jgi:hypothetical protein